VASKANVVYWDTCLFFALINEEQRNDPSEMPGLYACVSEIDAGTVGMVTSSVMKQELLERPLRPESQDRLNKILQRTNVDVVPFNDMMAERAAQLRAFYASNPGPKLGRFDASHLATAIALNVDAFFTFDANDKQGQLGLIPLSGNVAGYPLEVCRPRSIKGELRLDL
jgi:predicted nucleic acid-binding protein